MATSSLVRRDRTPATPKKGRLRPPGRRTGYAYIAPFFVLFLAFSLYPWLDTAWVSLHDVRLTTYQDQTWIGLDNYRNLLSNKFFWNAFANTVTIGIISTVLSCAWHSVSRTCSTTGCAAGRSSGSRC